MKIVEIESGMELKSETSEKQDCEKNKFNRINESENLISASNKER